MPETIRDRAGRDLKVTDDPLMTAPQHPWDDPDRDGHNCHGCPPDGLWRCDRLAHNVELEGNRSRVPYCYEHSHFIDGPICDIGAVAHA